MALMALSMAQCSWYSIVITAGCVKAVLFRERLCELQMVEKRLILVDLRQAGETVGWLSNSMIYDRHARLPHKTHIVGFNLDLNHQPLPMDSAEWRRMMRWHRPRTDTHRQNPPRCAQDVSDFATHFSVVFVHQVLWRSTQSMYPDSLFFLQVAHLYQWLYFYILCNETWNWREARRSSIKQCNFLWHSWILVSCFDSLTSCTMQHPVQQCFRLLEMGHLGGHRWLTDASPVNVHPVLSDQLEDCMAVVSS